MIKILLFFVLLLSTHNAFALPADWHGVFGVDSTLIDSYRRIDAEQTNSTGPGTQEPSLANGSHANSSFQSYLLRLSPEIIVNDSSTFKAEITTGYGRGGRLGDNSTTDKGNNLANGLYYYNTNKDNSTNLNFTQFNMTLYSDTATYVIGRHSYYWGIGAVINDGQKLWDRHLYVRDGLTAKFKIGNFEISPFFSKIGSSESLTKATKVREFGTSLLYDNPDKDMAFGLYYSKKENNAFNGTVGADVNSSGSNTNFGKTETKLTDFYFRKSFKKFTIQTEIPLLSGEIGKLYNTTSNSKYKAKAFLFEAKQEISESFDIFTNFGNVSGHSGVQSSFDAMYLNPNYQIANLLFRYNLHAISDTSKSVFDSYLTNASFFKLGTNLRSDRSTWTFAAIYAKANEVAKSGSSSFNHEKNKIFTANSDQSDDLGTEIDIDFDYRWNNETHIGASMGYLFTGDYFAFSNTSTPNQTQNSFAVVFKSSLEF